MNAAILLSLPTRERGLKHDFRQSLQQLLRVAPYAGAWIETRLSYGNLLQRLSLPTRERGLKQHNAKIMSCKLKSLPTRERGLKLHFLNLLRTLTKSLPTRERGLKPIALRNFASSRLSRSLRGSVD